MKKTGMFLVVSAALLCAGCTQQMSARYTGGTANIDLPPCHKLINVTWKDDSLWRLTRPMTSDDKVETYSFDESSSFGVWEGTVVISERRDNTCGG
jgi:hypothetical protein